MYSILCKCLRSRSVGEVILWQKFFVGSLVNNTFVATGFIGIRCRYQTITEHMPPILKWIFGGSRRWGGGELCCLKNGQVDVFHNFYTDKACSSSWVRLRQIHIILTAIQTDIGRRSHCVHQIPLVYNRRCCLSAVRFFSTFLCVLSNEQSSVLWLSCWSLYKKVIRPCYLYWYITFDWKHSHNCFGILLLGCHQSVFFQSFLWLFSSSLM